MVSWDPDLVVVLLVPVVPLLPVVPGVPVVPLLPVVPCVKFERGVVVPVEKRQNNHET